MQHVITLYPHYTYFVIRWKNMIYTEICSFLNEYNYLLKNILKLYNFKYFMMKAIFKAQFGYISLLATTISCLYMIKKSLSEWEVKFQTNKQTSLIYHSFHVFSIDMNNLYIKSIRISKMYNRCCHWSHVSVFLRTWTKYILLILEFNMANLNIFWFCSKAHA